MPSEKDKVPQFENHCEIDLVKNISMTVCQLNIWSKTKKKSIKIKAILKFVVKKYQIERKVRVETGPQQQFCSGSPKPKSRLCTKRFSLGLVGVTHDPREKAHLCSDIFPRSVHFVSILCPWS